MRIGTPMSENENWAHGKKKKKTRICEEKKTRKIIGNNNNTSTLGIGRGIFGNSASRGENFPCLKISIAAPESSLAK